MFDKTVTIHLKPTDIEILDNELVKTASIKLPDDVQYDPDFLYLILRAVSAGEYYDDNKNGDYFPENELKRNHTTFLKAHVFKNHENKDVKGSLGDVLRSTWDDRMKQVELLIRVDRRIAPQITRGIEKGYITDVSMGCRVDYSICSICGNKAKTQKQYCDHIKYMRRQILDSGKKVYEININPIFHDISIVLNGAEKVAKIEGIYIPEAKTQKKAGLQEEMLEKVASYNGVPQKKNDFSNLILENKEVLASLKDNDNLSKKDYLSKVADIQKRIEADIVGSSVENIANERTDKIQSMRNLLKAFKTEYLTDDDISSIVKQLKNIGVKNNCSLQSTFNQFVKILDFAGIELSPYEFSRFMNHITGIKTSISANGEVKENLIKEVDKICAGCNEETTLPKAMVRVTAILKRPSILQNTGAQLLPTLRKTIFSQGNIIPDKNPEHIQSEIMRSVVSPLIPRRSMHPRAIIIRVKKNENIAPQPDNYSCFVKPKNVFDAISRILYEIYQKDRMERLASGEAELGMQKFASYFSDCKVDTEDSMFSSLISLEKTAKSNFDYLNYNKTQPENLYNTATAVALGYPIINIISKFERAKISNGSSVSNFGRFVADYPADIHQFQSLFGPAMYAYAKNKAVSTGKGITSAAKGIFGGSYSKYAPTPQMLKSASETCKKQNIDAGKQKIFDTVLNLRAQNQDSAADKLLKKFKLSEKDLNFYLQNKKNCYTMLLNDEIKKTASFIDSNESFKLPSGFGGAIGCAALVDFVYNTYKK